MELTRVYWKTNKYNAKKASYGGTVYHSKLEAGYAQELDLRKKAGDIKEWERQYKISFDIDGQHICNHYVDFLIHHTDGTKELVECKGIETEAYRLKRKLLHALYLPQHPDTRYTVQKYQPSYNALTQRRKKPTL